MKKFILAMMLAVTAACCALTLNACAGSHTHSWSDWTATEGHAPTCTDDGLESRYCTDCGESEERPAAKLGHDWGDYTHSDDANTHTRTCKRSGCNTAETNECEYEVKIVEPTCQKGGFSSYICKVCNFSYTSDETGPVDHKFGEWKHEDVLVPSPDGTSTPSAHARYCIYECGESEREFCATFNIVTVPADCETDGYSTYTCTVCGGGVYDEVLPATDHDWKNPTHAYVIDGKHMHVWTCAHDSSHTMLEECTDSDPVITEPTCGADGYTTYTCDVCAFNYTDNPTSATGEHSWEAWEFVEDSSPWLHGHTCPTCGAFETQRCTETIKTVDPTCADYGFVTTSCQTCKHSQSARIDMLGHDFGTEWTHFEKNGEDWHSRTCRRENCGEAEEERCVMVSIEEAPTCTNPSHITEICEKCLYSETTEGTDVLEHTWSVWSYDKNNRQYRTCSVCHTRQEEDCHYTVTLVAGSCTTYFRYKYQCPDCDHTYYEYDYSISGHIWGEWEITDSVHSHSCTTCGKVEKFEHDYSETNICSVCLNDGLVYALNGVGTYYIVLHDENVSAAKTIIIPETHNGKPVKEISDSLSTTGKIRNGFSGNKSIQHLIIPQSLITIGMRAFEGCTSLSDVTVRGEGDGEFTPALISIGAYAFYGCKSLVSATNIPDTLETIGSYAFAECSALADIRLPENVKTVGDNAFKNTAYYNNEANWDESGVLYISHHLIHAMRSIVGEYTVKPGTLSVGMDAFSGCDRLTGITIPSSVKTFNDNAFYGCEGLLKVVFEGTFADWLDITFENDYSTPLFYANNLSITEAHSQIIIPDGKTSIPAGTFKDTSITSVYIPASVTTIGDNAFLNCINLETIIIAEGSQLTSIGKDAFKGTAFYANMQNWTDGLLYIDSVDGNSFLVASAAERIANGAVTIKSGTLVIADYAFYHNANVTQVIIPDSVLTIGEYAFSECSLEEVTIGTGVKIIGDYAFYKSALQKANFTVEPNTWWMAYNQSHEVLRTVSKTVLGDPAAAARELTVNSYRTWKKLF